MRNRVDDLDHQDLDGGVTVRRAPENAPGRHAECVGEDADAPASLMSSCPTGIEVLLALRTCWGLDRPSVQSFIANPVPAHSPCCADWEDEDDSLDDDDDDDEKEDEVFPDDDDFDDDDDGDEDGDDIARKARPGGRNQAPATLSSM